MTGRPTAREKLHGSLRKARDAYRAVIKRSRYKAEIAQYNQKLGLNVRVSDFERAQRQTACDVEEYFGYEFYKKSEQQRDEYLTRRRRDALARELGDVVAPLTIPGNKVLFNLLFPEFLHREWLNLTAASPQQFADFVRRHGEVIVKPSGENSGIGIFKYAYEDDEAAFALHRRLCGGGFVAEELLRQHPELARFNPHSVNSLRVATYTDADEVHILAASLRMSVHRDVCVDNLHAGGCACAVDPRTGVIISEAFNNNFERLAQHPMTGEAFMGFQLPMWDRALETVCAVARRAYELPQCRFLGWDIVLQPDDVAVVEGNWMQACDLIQYARGGIYHELLRLSAKR